MAIGLIGRKVGMTRIFTEDGTSIPVTVIEATPNRVTQVRSEETDGYRALQVTTGTKKANRVNKAEAGHFAKAGVEAGRTLVEFRLEDNEGAEIEVGSEIALVDAESGELMGSMTVAEKYRIDKEHECRTVFGTTDLEHPGVKMVMEQGEVNLAGPVKVFSQGEFPEKYQGFPTFE